MSISSGNTTTNNNTETILNFELIIINMWMYLMHVDILLSFWVEDKYMYGLFCLMGPLFYDLIMMFDLPLVNDWIAYTCAMSLVFCLKFLKKKQKQQQQIFVNIDAMMNVHFNKSWLISSLIRIELWNFINNCRIMFWEK